MPSRANARHSVCTPRKLSFDISTPAGHGTSSGHRADGTPRHGRAPARQIPADRKKRHACRSQHYMPAYVSLRSAVADGVSPGAADLLRRQHERGLGDHGVCVARLTIAVCHTLELDDAQTAAFARAALFHDVGKLEIPSHILDRRAALTSSAWSVVRRHPELGERLVAEVAELADVAPIVRHHHERWDGLGYPDGLAGAEIPLGARIVFACDAFDAMTSPRPYRPTLTTAAALEEVRAGAGTQFDAVVAAAVVDTVTSSEHLTDGPAPAR